MRSKNRSLRIVVVLALVLAVLELPAAYAKKDSSYARSVTTDNPQFEIFTSALHTDVMFAVATRQRTGVGVGLRGAYPLSKRFSLEGSLCKLENSFTLGDVLEADLSAKFYAKNTGRTAVYLLGGAGVMTSLDFGGEEATVHFGVGLEILAGSHLYVRPEVRGRWFTDYLNSRATLGELSLGVGWRF